MGIRFYCQSCQQKLNVKAFLAGKRGICPHCGATVLIPLESQIPSRKERQRTASAAGAKTVRSDRTPLSAAAGQPAADESVDLADQSVNLREALQAEVARDATAAQQRESHPPMVATGPVQYGGSDAVADPLDGLASAAMGESSAAAGDADPIAENPSLRWYVRPPSGGQYGPVDGHGLRQWIEEGRVSADSLVWREDWPEWQTAGSQFPWLAEAIAHARTASPVAAPAAIAQQPAGTAKTTVHRVRRRRSSGLELAIVMLLSVLVVVLAIAVVVVISSRRSSAPDRPMRSSAVQQDAAFEVQWIACRCERVARQVCKPNN